MEPGEISLASRSATSFTRGAFSTRPSLLTWSRTGSGASWIDAPIRPGKRPGAFCAYTVPSQHPYLLLNWTARRRDVLTLAHEMGHGLHAYLARGQGIYHQTTPLTLAETASVFGETVTFGRLLDATDDAAARLVQELAPRASELLALRLGSPQAARSPCYADVPLTCPCGSSLSQR